MTAVLLVLATCTSIVHNFVTPQLLADLQKKSLVTGTLRSKFAMCDHYRSHTPKNASLQHLVHIGIRKAKTLTILHKVA